MSDLRVVARWLLLLLAMASGPVLVLSLSDGSRPSVDAVHLGFTNTVFAGFMLTSVLLVLTLLAYGDSRDRPSAPVVGILVFVFVGFALGLRVLEVGNHLSGNGSSRAQFFSRTWRGGCGWPAQRRSRCSTSLTPRGDGRRPA
jgi:hypothetical protein